MSIRPIAFLFWSLFSTIGLGQEKPPYSGTIFPFPDLIKESDPTTLVELKAKRKAERKMFDRRTDKFGDYDVFLFEAEFEDSDAVEVAVNAEFGTEEVAREQAQLYAEAFGRLPKFLRENITELWIHRGKHLFGGGTTLTIHTEQGQEYIRDKILEETLGHEAAHALDAEHARNKDWIAAQESDGNFISTYAKANLFREDVAESFIPYLAVRYRPDRTERKHLDTISETIPARLAYFDSLKPDMNPIEGGETPAAKSGLGARPKLPTAMREWKSAAGKPLRARLVRFADREKTVGEFQREDGQKFNIRVLDFSEEDRAMLNDLRLGE